MIELYKGDCLEVMKKLPDNSIDMILCDLPYEVTHNEWDTIIPFDKLWQAYEKIITDNGAIVLFAQDKFTARLMLSNEKLHRYNLIWDKVIGGGWLNANKMPLRVHEDICVFYKKLPTYNPKKVQTNKINHKRGSKNLGKTNNKQTNYGTFDITESQLDGVKNPTSILSFQKLAPTKHYHPTQKPVDLLEYLIKTYTNENMVVLDNCMGSGSTGVDCINTNRNFIGIELNEEYFNISVNRCKEALPIFKQNELEIK